MVLSEPYWDHHIPLPKLGPLHSRLVTAFVALICFINSYNGDFVFDDSEAIINNKVAGIVGRADLLCALFFQLSFLVYCKAFQGGDKKFSVLWIFSSILLCAVAMLCKEQGITVLGVNAAFDILMVCCHSFGPNDLWINFYFLFSTQIGGLVSSGLLMRWRIMGTGPPSFTEVDNPASFAENVILRIVNYNYYYSLNAWLLLCPWWLCFDWSMGCVPLIKSATDWRIVWPLLLWCCLMGLVYQALCSQDSNKRRTLTFGLVLLVIPFLPASNLFFRVGFVIAERVLYLSSAGYCLILAYTVGYCSCHWKKHKVCAATLTLLCVNVARSAQRSQHWRSEQSLFTSALSVCPLNAKVHYNVGKNLADRGNQSAAVKYYREAVRLHPKYVHAMNNLGNILKERNELEEAEELLSSAVHIQPDFAAAWMNLGIVQNSLKKFDKAEQSYLNAIKFRKKYPDCYYNLGRLYADLNRSIDALNAWRNATMLKPDHSLAWNNMVILLDNTGNLAQAELIGKEALKILPKDHTIMFSLANVLGKQKKYKESEGFFLNALKINPNVASCHGNLAVLYHRWGKLDLAKRHYELSLRLDPNAPGTKENYNMLKRKLEQRQRTVG
uniref:dolichyl-phosphate-mannose--protein mannosyltransferase n=1 Tax=Cyprinus carpio carpio TaxID=630221 RepID=A0A9J7YP15_CYPCA